MIVSSLILQKIFDSRGDATLGIDLSNQAGMVFNAKVPSGKSRGKREAAVLDFAKAKNALQKKILPAIAGRNFRTVSRLDKFLLKLDGTKNKSKLGGNLLLAISIAATRAIASERKLPVWKLLKSEFFKFQPAKRPVIFSNLINGGAHARNKLTFQEYMVIVPPKETYRQTIGDLIDFYRKLGEYLVKITKTSTLATGDEGGYSINFRNSFEPISALKKLIATTKESEDYAIGLDIAASNFFNGKAYLFDGKKLKSEELLDLYVKKLIPDQKLVSIEDPFAEEDFDSFAKLKKAASAKFIVGDDLTVTSSDLIKKAANQRAINGVIIKPNQIGTVTESCLAIKMAHQKKIKTIISHRSGETSDAFIIHLAKAAGVYGVKIGAPVHERIEKFDELIELYD